MNSRLFGTAAALVAALATVTCKEDPTATLSGGATRLLVSPNPVFLSEGSGGTFTASAVNDALRPIRAEITATSADVGTVTVTPNNVAPDPNGTSQLFDLEGLVPGQVLVTVTGAGLSTQDTVYVLPLFFGGTGSTASPQVGRQFTLNSTANLKFDATANLRFGDRDAGGEPTGNYGELVSRTVDAVTVVVPQPEEAQPASITVEGVVVTFAPGSLFDLPTSTLFDVVNPFDPNDDPDPAAIFTSDTTFYDGFKSSQANNFYRMTVPAGTVSVNFLLQWEGASDIDILVCDVGCNALAGTPPFAAATGNNPEDGTMVLAPGNYNLWVNLYDAHDEVPHLYKLTINFN